MNNIGNTLFALFLVYMRLLYIIYSTPAFPTKHLTIYPRTSECNLNRLEDIFIKYIILMTRSGCRKREKRQRVYNHSFVSHQKTFSSFYSLVSILSKRRTCLLYKRQNHASSPCIIFLLFLPSFLFFLVFLSTLSWHRGRKDWSRMLFLPLLFSADSSPFSLSSFASLHSIFFPLGFSFVSLETLR